MCAKFGPAGSADSFHAMGYRKTAQMPEYLEKLGLNAFEYQCGRGVRISREAAQELGRLSRERGIALSLHAPYLISLSSIEKEKRDYGKTEIEDIKALYDASVNSNGKMVSIQKELDEKTEGDVVFEFKTSADWSSIFALEINNLSGEQINIGLKIYDSKGNGATRYYMPLTEGKNLVVFDARGFLESDGLEDIKTVWLRFYDHNLIQEETNIELGELWIMDNMNALYECVTSSEYKINPQ